MGPQVRIRVAPEAIKRLKSQLRGPDRAAHAHVREQYVGDAHLLRYARLLGTLIGEG